MILSRKRRIAASLQGKEGIAGVSGVVRRRKSSMSEQEGESGLCVLSVPEAQLPSAVSPGS